MWLCSNTALVVSNEFWISCNIHEVDLLLIFLPPFRSVEIILGSWAIQTRNPSPLCERRVWMALEGPPRAAANRPYTLNTDYWKVLTCSVYQADVNFPEINKKHLLPSHVPCHEHRDVYQIHLTQEICTADFLGQEALYILQILF